MAVKDEGVEDRDGVEVLAPGGMEDGEIDGECVSALSGSAAKYDFTKDDRLAECLLGMVVGWGHAIDVEEGEEALIIALGIEETQAETLGIRVRDGVGAKGVQLVVEFWDMSLGVPEGDFACVALTSKITRLRKETAEVVTEGDGLGVGFAGGEQGNELGDVPCFADEMSQARLAMGGMDGVITGIVIGDQGAMKLRSEDGGGHIPGTGAVDVEETEIRGACIPEIGRLSVETPPRFVTMDNVGRMNLVAECLVMRFSGFGDGMGEGHGRGRDKGHGEEIAEDAAHITQG